LIYSEVEKKFNAYINKKLKDHHDIRNAVNRHSSKRMVIEKICDELFRAENKMDLRYHRRYDQIVEAAANLYMKRLVSTMEYDAKSAIEKTRIQREDERDKKLNNLIDKNEPITDKMLFEE